MANDFQPLAGQRITLVSNGFQTNYERGFTNGLAALGAEVTLISSDTTDYAGLLPSVKTANLRGSQDASRSAWSKRFNFFRYQAAMIWHMVWAGRPIIQIIGLIDPPLLSGIFDGFFFKALSSRYVMTVHNLLPQDGCSPKKAEQYGQSYRMAEHLVVHTEGMKAKLCAQFGVEPDRVTVMEHGLEPLPAAPLPPPKPAGTPLQLLAFGHVKPYKGTDILLKALETFEQPFVLKIVGHCRDAGLTRETHELIAAHPKAAQISWRNEHVEESEMERLFTESDVLVMPYRHIDQSGVLFQALRFGLPIVATQVGSLPHYITPEIGETCPPNDPAALTEALLRMSRRYGAIDRASIVAAGRRWEWRQTIAVAAPSAYALRPVPRTGQVPAP